MKDRSLLIENDKKIPCYNFISLDERPHIWANFFLFYNNTPGIIRSQIGTEELAKFLHKYFKIP